MIAGLDRMEYDKLSEAEFMKFSELIRDIAGIYLKDTKLTLLSNRLRKRLKEKDFKTYDDYFRYIKSSNDYSEIDEMLNAVSTNETYFFRSNKHGEALVRDIIPDMMEKKRCPIKIWSAGCSTGEEPLTIAAMLKEADLLDKRYVEIYASDINTQVLRIAENGIYDKRKFRAAPDDFITKYFKKIDDDKYEIDRNLAKFVNYSRVNLKKDKFMSGMDVIFCRNVMIYFDKEDQKVLVDKFYDSLNNDGYLFIGHSESLYFIENRFIYKKIKDAPVYYKE